MKVKEIRYGRTMNLGDFNSEKIEFMAEIDEDEDELEIIARLKQKIELAKTKKD